MPILLASIPAYKTPSWQYFWHRSPRMRHPHAKYSGVYPRVWFIFMPTLLASIFACVTYPYQLFWHLSSRVGVRAYSCIYVWLCEYVCPLRVCVCLYVCTWLWIVICVYMCMCVRACPCFSVCSSVCLYEYVRGLYNHDVACALAWSFVRVCKRLVVFWCTRMARYTYASMCVYAVWHITRYFCERGCKCVHRRVRIL